MTFSVIIPVYNVEKYLKRCLDSIINQGFTDYELLLIDDGSSDNSGLICDKYSLKYPFINVIHQKNGGISKARNRGIESAKGNYLIFIDSDDYIAQKSLEQIANELKTSHLPDLLITQIHKFNDNCITSYSDLNLFKNSSSTANKEEVINKLFNYSETIWPAWRYIVKRTFVEKHHMRFPESYLHEDMDWTTKIFLLAETVKITNLSCYFHRLNNKTSITNNRNLQNSLDIITLIALNIQFISENSYHSKSKNAIIKRLTKSFFTAIKDYEQLKKIDKEKIKKLIYQNKKNFKKNMHNRYLIFFLSTNLFGFDFSYRIYNTYIKIKLRLLKRRKQNVSYRTTNK